MYLITSCASCAAPLEPTGTGVKKCSRCKTRYCSASCQRDHWKKRGGHKTTCEKIAAEGGAEKSYATEKHVDAIEEAITACLPDQPAAAVTCYICERAARRAICPIYPLIINTKLQLPFLSRGRRAAGAAP